MAFFKNYIKEHNVIFFVSLCLWLGGVFLGMYIAFRAKSDIREGLGEYLNTALSSKSGYADTLKNGIMINLKYISCLCASSLFLLSLPVCAFLIGFKGFACGFGASFLIRLYSIKGVAACITSVVLPMAFSLPVYFIIFVSCLGFPVYNFKMRNEILSGERWSLNLAHLVKIFILFLCLCLITAFEAFLSPLFLSVLTKG